MIYRATASFACCFFLTSIVMAFENYDDILAARVVVHQPPATTYTARSTSAIKSATIIKTELGEATIAPTEQVIYEVHYRIGNGDVKSSRMAGNDVVINLKQMEYVASRDGQTFSIIRIREITQ